MKKVMKWVEHNRFFVLSALVFVVGMAWVGGCAANGISPLDPAREVTRDELDGEVAVIDRMLSTEKATLDAQIAAFNAKVEEQNKLIDNAYSTIARGEEHRAKLIAFTLESLKMVASGTAPTTMPGALSYLLTGLFAMGVGATADNIRKRAVISTLKSEKK